MLHTRAQNETNDMKNITWHKLTVKNIIPNNLSYNVQCNGNVWAEYYYIHINTIELVWKWILFRYCQACMLSHLIRGAEFALIDSLLYLFPGMFPNANFIWYEYDTYGIRVRACFYSSLSFFWKQWAFSVGNFNFIVIHHKWQDYVTLYRYFKAFPCNFIQNKM